MRHESGQPAADVAIHVRGVSKCYQIYDRPQDRLKQSIVPRLRGWVGKVKRDYFREFWAVRDVSFEVNKGETVGIIGRNGSGKSTLLQMICGTLTPSSGDIEISGRVAALLELGSGFNPEFTGRENVFLNGSILGLTQREIAARFDQIVEFADIGNFIDQPVKTYSSGMFVRLAFAVQAHIDASIVVIDEALAVGDVFFRQRCYARLDELRNAGAAILLVSHSMPDIEQYCNRAVLLDRGRLRFIGPASEATKHYYLLHQSHRANHASGGGVTVAPEGQHNNGIHRVIAASSIDISAKPQVSNGQARCTGLALCGAGDVPCNVFRQGDTAVFFYEFAISNVVGIPICGIVIKNERGVNVHGKNSWQTNADVTGSLDARTKVSCRQEIKLDLAPGEYTFEVGLAVVPATTWKNRDHISHDAMSSSEMRLCHVPDVHVFSIGLAVKNEVAVLTHHGIADLAGNIEMTVS